MALGQYGGTGGVEMSVKANEHRWAVSGFWLKLIMAGLMTLDHIRVFFPQAPLWFHILGRLVAPTFIYLVAESLRWTRDRRRFIGRMLTAGFLMLLGQIILATAFSRPDLYDFSMLIALGINSAFIRFIERFNRKRNLQDLLAGVIVLLLAFIFEGSWVVTIMLSIFYFLDGHRVWMFGAYGALCVLIGTFHSFFGPWQWAMIFAIIPILLYNGQRGPSGRFAKYFFYVFYPAHIGILFALSMVLG